MRIRKLAAAALLGVSALSLAACATGLPTRVSRYQVMPAATGQSFYIVPGQGVQGGIEFGHYAQLVSQQMQARGYRQAAAPQVADMVVKLAYDVDEGKTETRIDPIGPSRFRGGFYDPFWGRPYYSRFGYYSRYRDPFFWGWDDPFWYASPYGGFGSRGYADIRQYTVYHSELDLDIVRRADNVSLFEGNAKARSQTDELGVLVPNLIEAMFTNFPGRSGETVKITVPARRRS